MATKKKITEKDWRLARKIQKIRQEKGWTQEKLAERVGVSTTYIGYVETGYRVPNLKMIYKIANALKIKVSELFPF
ncbi:MAG: helix-turn-helix domain-containing protein [Candidatus Levyibacteriota bacterium]